MGNDQQREGKWDQAKGTVKENVGDLTGNEQMEREGQADQVAGRVREGVGDMRQGIERVAEGMRKGYDNVTRDDDRDQDRDEPVEGA